MKSVITLLSVLLFFVFTSEAQHDYEWYNNGDTVCIQPGSLLCIQGDMHNNGNVRQAWLNNNGFIEVQGNLYSNKFFQQRGIGTLRLQNRQVNLKERQFIQGEYGVRGGQSKIGKDDGSFFNLELNNSNGFVYLKGNGNVADVRHRLNFKASSRWIDDNFYTASHSVNTLVTHDIGSSGSFSFPANGTNYSATFGLMNPDAGLDNLRYNTVSTHGTHSNVDSGYIIGKFRRAIDPAKGGKYGFPVGLEPSSSISASRGLQYLYVDCKPNKLDYITAFFQQGSSNFIFGNIVYCAGTVTNYYGTRSGEWMLSAAGAAVNDFNMAIFPQDYVAAPSVSYFITRNNSFAGNQNDCFTSVEGLSRGGFTSFGEFGFAGVALGLPMSTLVFSGKTEQCDVLLTWSHSPLEKVQSFDIEVADMNSGFRKIATIKSYNISNKYSYLIKNAPPNGFYRLKIIDPDLKEHYSVVENVPVRCSNSSGILIFPNPFTGNELQIRFENFAKDDYTIEVFSSNGAIVLKRKIILTNANQQINIDGLEILSKGTYWVKISNAFEVLVTDKIIKQ